ncbi:MAG: thioredoxin domain-containing protein, partial [Planctomycetes bacterium]|nr:thioredoxin domain-containing protein [Planctomycetota bacterium]
IEGLLNLYEATFDLRWLHEAEALADTCHAAYFNSDKGGFFLTANDAEKLIARSQNAIEGAIPSGNAVHALNLLRLAVYFDRKDLRDQAESIFKAYGQSMERIPQAFERMLCALDFYYGKPKEIALVPGSAGDLNSLVRTVYAHYLPNKVLAAATDAQSASAMPLLKGKTTIDGRPTAYVCQNYTCKRPVQTSEELKALLWSVDKKE